MLFLLFSSYVDLGFFLIQQIHFTEIDHAEVHTNGIHLALCYEIRQKSFMWLGFLTFICDLSQTRNYLCQDYLGQVGKSSLLVSQIKSLGPSSLLVTSRY